jgi:hypothetical protein
MNENQLLSNSGDDNDRAVADESDSDDEIAGFVSGAEKWLEIIRDRKAK